MGVGALLDLFVGPYLLDPSHFDVHLNFEDGSQLISEYLLELCGHGWSFKSIKDVVREYVPFEVAWTDGSALLCIVVQLLQCWVGGTTRGKGRFQECQRVTPKN